MRVSGALLFSSRPLSSKQVRSIQSAISGNVKRSRFRRPKVSIVRTAGIANTKLMMPKPMLPRSAVRIFP